MPQPKSKVKQKTKFFFTPSFFDGIRIQAGGNPPRLVLFGDLILWDRKAKVWSMRPARGEAHQTVTERQVLQRLSQVAREVVGNATLDQLRPALPSLKRGCPSAPFPD
jgi:hypothetical protein